jgi:hypothetical protein
MNILYKSEANLFYKLEIAYHYFGLNNELCESQFTLLEEFQDFMSECHPEISLGKVVEKFNGCVAKLMAKANDVTFDYSYPITYLHCGICGDELFASTFDAGVIEKMSSYKEASDKANDGYINTSIAHSWTFAMEGEIMRVKFWYDPADTTSPTFKIHSFKDKIILSRTGGINSVIRTDKYYVHCEGVKKPDK